MYDIFNQVKSTMNLDKNQLYGFQVLKLKLYILMYVNFGKILMLMNVINTIKKDLCTPQ